MKNVVREYGFLWVTLVLFIASLAGHWMFAWSAYVHEQEAHSQSVEMREFIQLTMRDTLENWQSEFLQLVWQVAGLAFLLYVGSPQSKEGDERKEEKIDLILTAVDPSAREHIRQLDKKYSRRK